MQVLEKRTSVRILFLDDDQRAIDNFSVKIRDYNASEESFVEGIVVELETTTDIAEAVSKIQEIDNDYDVFICDHNMPVRKGLELITKLVKKERPDLLCVLYTGGDNLNDSMKQELEKHRILYCPKSQEMTLVMEKVHQRLLLKEDPMNALYKKIASDIIADMTKLQNSGASFKIHTSSGIITPQQLIVEITKRTSIGIEFLMSYIDGLKFFK